MKKDYLVPLEVQNELAKKANIFNAQYLTKSGCAYIPNVRGKFIYLMRVCHDGSIEKIGRLTYDGDIENMDFAIFKYSTEGYDASEPFPGDKYLDGTIEGAMKACLKAYPI